MQDASSCKKGKEKEKASMGEMHYGAAIHHVLPFEKKKGKRKQDKLEAGKIRLGVDRLFCCKKKKKKKRGGRVRAAKPVARRHLVCFLRKKKKGEGNGEEGPTSLINSQRKKWENCVIPPFPEKKKKREGLRDGVVATCP